MERRKLRVNLSRFVRRPHLGFIFFIQGDIIDKARTIESLTNLNEKLQHCLVDSRVCGLTTSMVTKGLLAFLVRFGCIR